jgi:hypothetical protein
VHRGEHLGVERRPAHPDEQDVRDAVRHHLPGEPLQVGDDLVGPFRRVEPSEPVADLGRVLVPHGVIAVPDPGDDRERLAGRGLDGFGEGAEHHPRGPSCRGAGQVRRA